MRILFITIPFYEYISEISHTISCELNAQVDVIYCDLIPSLYNRVLDKLCNGNLQKKYNRNEQIKQFAMVADKEYDYIFVLVGRNIEIDILKSFCKEQVKAKKILYLWDDVARINTFKHIYKLFDKVYSFDTIDCVKYGFEFLPLFYCNQYRYGGEEKIYNLSCVGGLHSSRENYLNKVTCFCHKYNFSNYFHLRTTRSSVIKEILKGDRQRIPSFVKYNDLSMRESSEILKRSVCAVDMPHPTQTGLTIRTIEALASHTKLITTNKAIKEYDFYNENNILITDYNCSNLTEEFIKKSFVNIDEKIVEKYSLNSWIKNIFKGG